MLLGSSKAAMVRCTSESTVLAQGTPGSSVKPAKGKKKITIHKLGEYHPAILLCDNYSWCGSMLTLRKLPMHGIQSHRRCLYTVYFQWWWWNSNVSMHSFYLKLSTILWVGYNKADIPADPSEPVNQNPFTVQATAYSWSNIFTNFINSSIFSFWAITLPTSIQIWHTNSKYIH